jgi:hypothetical protein
LAKAYHCPRELFSRKCSVHRCKVTYFCAIDQFREHLEAIILNSLLFLHLRIITNH